MLSVLPGIFLLKVEIVYAVSEYQWVRQLNCPPDATIRDVIALSGLLRDFPELNFTICTVGIYGELFTLDHCVQNGDRVEIYRPLIADPLEIRKRSSSQARKPSD